MQALRTAVRADKRALVASTLDRRHREPRNSGLSTTSTSVTSMQRTGRWRAGGRGLVAYDKPLSNAFAKSLAAEMLAATGAQGSAGDAKSVLKVLPPKRRRATFSSKRIRAFRTTTSRSDPLVK
jgi:hypothetical protein